MAEQRVQLSVASPYDVVYTGFSATVSRLGTAYKMVLSDDGRALRDDKPYDGVYVGEITTDYSAWTDLSISGTLRTGETVTLYTGTVRTSETDVVLAFQVRSMAPPAHGPPQAARVAAAWPESAAPVPEGLPILGAFLWAALIAVMVSLKLSGAQSPGRR
ncbi:MAG: hypothetical protein EXR69_10870 [Myxococcales bacterium]|nr:hypothetical protein [Myxococcales bacterium]